MNPLWSYFWPVFAIGLLAGGLSGSVAFRRKSMLALLLGAIFVMGAAAAWHGPLGGAARLSARVERGARQALDYYEMTQVTARLHRSPVTRRLLLAGQADDFQRRELVRLLGQLRGVSGATWNPRPRGIPLIVEGTFAGLAGFLFGLLLAYLVELRRRYNAQWKW